MEEKVLCKYYDKNQRVCFKSLSLCKCNVCPVIEKKSKKIDSELYEALFTCYYSSLKCDLSFWLKELKLGHVLTVQRGIQLKLDSK